MVNFCGLFSSPEEERVEVTDGDAVELSHVGNAAYNALRKRHGWHHLNLWNVTSGKMIGDLHQTPANLWRSKREPSTGQDDWFPQKMIKIMSRTKTWCDIMSLGKFLLSSFSQNNITTTNIKINLEHLSGPPDGLFLEKMKEGLKTINDNAASAEKPVIIRMMVRCLVVSKLNSSLKQF